LQEAGLLHGKLHLEGDVPHNHLCTVRQATE